MTHHINKSPLVPLAPLDSQEGQEGQEGPLFMEGVTVPLSFPRGSN